jgi:hypothetical protein
MKKLTLIAIALVAMAATFTSCKKDTTNDAAISLAGDAGYTATDATVAPGATFMVKWTATCTTTNMAFVSITKDDAALSSWDKKAISSSSESTYIDQATLTAPLNAGAYTYAIVIYDKDNNVLVSKSIVITVGVTGPSLGAEITNVKLYSADVNGANACAASSSGVIYTPETTATGDRGKVDFIWVYDNMYSVASTQASSDAGIQSICSGWSPANTTTFLKVTDIDYSTATYSQIFAKDASITGTIASSLAANDVVVFKTQAGKYGIFKVSSISGTYQTTDYIIINIKVQQ